MNADQNLPVISGEGSILDRCKNRSEAGNASQMREDWPMDKGSGEDVGVPKWTFLCRLPGLWPHSTLAKSNSVVMAASTLLGKYSSGSLRETSLPKEFLRTPSGSGSWLRELRYNLCPTALMPACTQQLCFPRLEA